jgi:hypothetical protein
METVSQKRSIAVDWKLHRTNHALRSRVLSGIAIVGTAIALLAGASKPATAHGGGLDGYGCHNDRKAGSYHCHRGPCRGLTFSSKDAMLRASCQK